MNKKVTTSVLALALLLASAVPALAGSTGVKDPYGSVFAQWSSGGGSTITGWGTATSHNPDLDDLKLYVTVYDGSTLKQSQTASNGYTHDIYVYETKKTGLLLQAAARSYYTNNTWSEQSLSTNTW
ncbi:hypothetical protein [Paenibacillus kobensis]|uniref:hypothetical protein n=1 Tax=Paenibacillus kobensis TaxID=59841 RepID=UPI000FD79B85|nr:hypothetical protein [Paenibacillus kobensis]